MGQQTESNIAALVIVRANTTASARFTRDKNDNIMWCSVNIILSVCALDSMGNTTKSNPTPTEQPLSEGETTMISQMTTADIAKLIELSANAAQEYLYLIQINEDLVKERQMLSLCLEDMQNNFSELKKSLIEDKRHTRQTSDMGMQLKSLRSQTIAFTIENEMLSDTINDLELQLKKPKENIKLEQFKQANRKRVGQKSLDLNNILSVWMK